MNYIFDKLNLVYEDRGIYLAMSTAYCHDGDSPRSLVYYKDSGRWVCFSRHCQEKYGNDFLGFLQAIKQISRDGAKELQNDLFNGSPPVFKPPPKIDYWKEHKTQEVLFISKFLPCEGFCKQRGLNHELTHEVMECGIYKQRFAVPIKNINGQLIGYSGRKLAGDGPKWKHSRFKKTLNLFNIHNAYKKIGETKQVIITEGPIDVIKLVMAGFDNSVCSMGTSLSNGQIELLGKSGAVNVILAYDNDEAGKTAAKRIQRKLESALYNTRILEINGFNDFGEMPVEQIKHTMSEV